MSKIPNWRKNALGNGMWLNTARHSGLIIRQREDAEGYYHIIFYLPDVMDYTNKKRIAIKLTKSKANKFAANWMRHHPYG